jgi:hypothetical protein
VWGRDRFHYRILYHGMAACATHHQIPPLRFATVGKSRFERFGAVEKSGIDSFDTAQQVPVFQS